MEFYSNLRWVSHPHSEKLLAGYVVFIQRKAMEKGLENSSAHGEKAKGPWKGNATKPVATGLKCLQSRCIQYYPAWLNLALSRQEK
jgi:hypothetical protein